MLTDVNEPILFGFGIFSARILLESEMWLSVTSDHIYNSWCENAAVMCSEGSQVKLQKYKFIIYHKIIDHTYSNMKIYRKSDKTFRIW